MLKQIAKTKDACWQNIQPNHCLLQKCFYFGKPMFFGGRLIHQRLLNLQQAATEAEERHCVGGNI